MTIRIKDAVIFITGANGGLGREFVRQALERGAAKIYATARTPREWDDPRVVPLVLDVTSEASVEAAADAAADTTILINNAGVYVHGDTIMNRSIDDVREMFETNFFGALRVGKAFAPIVGTNGGGAFLDVHSALSWLGYAGSYSASKAAFWSLTNSFRLELASQGTQVLGLHMGYVDTPMVAIVDEPKSSAESIVTAALNGLEAGEFEVLADDTARGAKAGLSGAVEDLYAELSRP